MRVLLILLHVLFVFLLCLRSNGSKYSHEMLIAAEKGETDKVVDLITNRGVFITTKNNYGVSALVFAANNGHLPLVKKLLSMGADIEDRANNWKTPLLCASLWGHYDVVVHLVESGANVSVYDNSGLTPLMSATLGNHVTIVRYLLAKGASPTTVNFVNGTALTIAKVKGHTELISILEPYFPSELEENAYYIMYQLIIRNIIFYSKLIAQQAKEVAIEFWTALNAPEAASVSPNSDEGFSRWSEAQDLVYSQRHSDTGSEDTKTILKKQQEEDGKWDL